MPDAPPDITPAGANLLDTAPEVVRATLRSPRVELPCAIRTTARSLFELPGSNSHTGQETELTVDLWDHDNRRLGERQISLPCGLVRPTWDTTEDNEFVTEDDLVAIGVDRLVNFHVERINEIVFPSRDQNPRRPGTAEGLTISSWENSRDIYWNLDDEDDDGPLRLIVRIAKECTEVLHSVCSNPRKALRRVRQKERFNRVQQMDDVCIRWFVRQPGRTIIQKAGPRREVMCVVRLESADTPENRVVRDFIERCIRECTSYLKSHGHREKSQRVKDVKRFRRSLIDSLRRSVLSEVPRPVGIPSPNYVLQFDDRYSVIWFWYDRLRRQQTGAENAWRWRRRILVEHCRLAIAQRLSRYEVAPPFAKQLFVRVDHDCGCFVEPRTMLGPWRSHLTPSAEVLYLFTSDDLEFARSNGLLPSYQCTEDADLVLIRVRPFDRQIIAAISIYVNYALDQHGAACFQKAAQDIAEKCDDDGLPPYWAIAMFYGDPYRADPKCLVTLSPGEGQRVVGTVALSLTPDVDSIDFDDLLVQAAICGNSDIGRHST